MAIGWEGTTGDPLNIFPNGDKLVELFPPEPEGPGMSSLPLSPTQFGENGRREFGL
jgi:hypothetical protein